MNSDFQTFPDVQTFRLNRPSHYPSPSPSPWKCQCHLHQLSLEAASASQPLVFLDMEKTLDKSSTCVNKSEEAREIVEQVVFSAKSTFKSPTDLVYFRCFRQTSILLFSLWVNQLVHPPIELFIEICYDKDNFHYFSSNSPKFRPIFRVFFFNGPLPKSSKHRKKLIQVRLGVSSTIYINVDSTYLGSPNFNILGEASVNKLTKLGDAIATQQNDSIIGLQDFQYC